MSSSYQNSDSVILRSDQQETVQRTMMGVAGTAARTRTTSTSTTNDIETPLISSQQQQQGESSFHSDMDSVVSNGDGDGDDDDNNNNNTIDNDVDDDDDDAVSTTTTSTTGSQHSSYSIQSGLPLYSMYPLPGMEINCHEIKKNFELQPCTQQDALSGVKKKKTKKKIIIKKKCTTDGSTTTTTTTNNTHQHTHHTHHYQQHYWVDINANPYHHSNELRIWLSKLNLPNYVIDVLAEPPEMWSSQIIPLQRASLAVIRILPEQSNSDEMTHLAALHMRNMLITFTSCHSQSTTTTSSTTTTTATVTTPLLAGNGNGNNASSSNGSSNLYELALARLKQRERLPAPTSAGALLAWLRFHLDRTSTATRELRYSVLAMDEAMDRDITNVSLDEIISAKDQVLRLLSVSEEQTACIESLAVVAKTTDEGFATTTTSSTSTSTSPTSSSLSTSSSSSSIRGALSILLATAEATERMTLRLEKHIIDLRQRCENYEHQQMNKRLSVLTVLSAIFLPLTLFTGIWGMNFADMPELEKPYAYPTALGFMISVAILMIYYFRRSGWFDH